MTKHPHLVPAILVLLCAFEPARAQETISTDRPGLGFNPTTVPAGVLQIEVGTPTLDFSGTGDDPGASVAGALRYGLSSHLEARVSTTWVVRSPTVEGAAGPTGMAGLRAGFKVEGVEAHGVSLALIPEVVLPVGNAALVADDPSWSLNAAAGIPLGGSSFTLVAGAQADPAGPDDYDTTGLLVAVLGRGLGDGTSGYLEAGVLPGPGEDAAYVGGGLAWLPTPHAQLDAWIDFGLTDAASDAALGVGFSFLVPRSR